MWLDEVTSQAIPPIQFNFRRELKFLFPTIAAPRAFQSPCNESRSPSPTSTALDMSILELMIQWSNKTYLSFSRDEETKHIWQNLVPQEALSYKFLMHGLLATSALQLASYGGHVSRIQYINKGFIYQNEALTEFQELLSEINKQNVKAIFAYSSILVVYSFGFLHLDNTDGSSLTTDHIYQILMLCRGVQQIIEHSKASIRDSNFKPILDFRQVACPLSLPDDAELALHQLHDANTTYSTQNVNHNTAVYKEAIDMLKEALNAAYQDQIAQNIVSRWAIKLPQPFLERIQSLEPMALVIMGFFCVVLHRLKDIWYFRGWGKTVIKLIWRTLEPQWKYLARWPMMEVLGEVPNSSSVRRYKDIE